MRRCLRSSAQSSRHPGAGAAACRVDGCPNRSRGPRAGFICDLHRAQLAPEEQRDARERWNARHRGGAPAAETQVRHETPVIAPVPPIVRKAEPAAESS